MLIASPKMIDIDVDHWRNLQSLLLDPASARPKIVLIHEDGELLKFVHSEGAEVVGGVDRVDDPREVAEKVYRANSGNADFVVVFERRALERYFSRVQDSWSSDEGVDDYVHRMYATLDEYPDGIVTYPDPPSTTLGLQWRVGAGYEEVTAAAERFVPPGSTVVFGVFEGEALWATLVLGFDEEKRLGVITTVEPAEITASGGRDAIAKDVVAWVKRKYPPCSLGLFVGLDGARDLLKSEDKPAAIRDLAEKGKLIADPIPEPLARPFAASGR